MRGASLIRRLLGLEVMVGYRGASHDVVARPADATHLALGVAVRTVRDPRALAAIEPALRALDPSFQGFTASPADLVAIAEERGRVVACWRFTVQGSSLSDCGVFVAPEARGRGVACALLQCAAVEMSGSTIYARTSVFNRSGRRMLARAGLVPFRISVSARVPGLGRVGTFWQAPRSQAGYERTSSSAE